VLSRGGFGGNSYGGGYGGGGGGGYGGGYGGGGGDRMGHLGAGLQKQDWGKSSHADFTALWIQLFSPWRSRQYPFANY
jgi:hypothetical protein